MHGRNLSLCLLLVTGTLSWSQVQPVHTSTTQEIDVYAGYSYLPVNVWKGSVNIYGGESGWNAGVDAKVYKWLSVTGDFAEYFSTYSSTDSSRTLTAMVGPRFFLPLRSSRIRPFGDVLIGVAHVSYTGFDGYTPFSTSTSFAWSADGGIDFGLSRHFALRAQGGYLRTGFRTSDSEVQQYVVPSHPRISAGVVYRF